MRSRRRTHHNHVAWSGSDEEFQAQTPQPAWDAAWGRVRAERKQAGLPNAYRANWLRFGAFLSPPASSVRILWPQFSRHSPLATRHSPLATRHSPLPPTTLPHWLLPATDHPIAKNRTSPISTNGLYIQYVTEPGDSCGKSIRYSLLAAVGPLTILPWPEGLNASRSKRACRMAIRRNACSLLALPDFPEFAQEVRYGVPGTRTRPATHRKIVSIGSSRGPTPEDIRRMKHSLVRAPAKGGATVLGTEGCPGQTDTRAQSTNDHRPPSDVGAVTTLPSPAPFSWFWVPPRGMETDTDCLCREAPAMHPV